MPAPKKKKGTAEVDERFPGKVIRLSAGHRAVVEERPEVKKAGGVYYTPTYIVDYIVKHTVGKLVDGKKPDQVAKLRILDPACGSGLFLLGAYQCLLDWHRDWYENNDPGKHARGREPGIFRAPGGGWRLTRQQRKRILLNNIYGVDIDPQAVEVAKLSLLLKVLEETSGGTIRGLQMRERALPDLDGNIKCGNSLVGPDFFAGRFDCDESERLHINAFDWSAEFPLIMKSGGFDAVIGNPPWVSLSGKFGAEIYSKEKIEYLTSRFGGNTYMPNMYEYFVSQGLTLTRKAGYFSFIVPDRLGFNGQFVKLRERILLESNVIALMYKAPFPKIVADTLIFVLQKGDRSKHDAVLISEYGRDAVEMSQDDMLRDPIHRFQYFESAEAMRLIAKIESLKARTVIKDLCDSTSGFGGKSALIRSTRSSERQIPALKGDSIGRYELKKQYWFDFRKENITGRTTDTGKLGCSPKILLRKTGDSITATYDESGIFPEQSLYFLFNARNRVSLKFILGVLNSRLLTGYYRAKSLTNRESIAQVKKNDLDELPIPVMNLSNSHERAHHEKMIKLVEQMLVLHEQLVAAKTGHEKNILQRRIGATDQQIDQLVYELYSLTNEEIKIVEDVELVRRSAE